MAAGYSIHDLMTLQLTLLVDSDSLAIGWDFDLRGDGSNITANVAESGDVGLVIKFHMKKRDVELLLATLNSGAFDGQYIKGAVKEIAKVRAVQARTPLVTEIENRLENER